MHITLYIQTYTHMFYTLLVVHTLIYFHTSLLLLSVGPRGWMSVVLKGLVTLGPDIFNGPSI